MRKLLYALGVLLALLLLAGLAGRWYLRTSLPDYGRDTRLTGLADPVEVWRDSLGVPHVWARSRADLYRTLGYLHAQDRLWQMELFRRVADGRLAEVLGPAALPSDRFLRTVGMGRVAAEEERRLGDEERALLEAYAGGVNAWIRGHGGALPPEFVVLRFRPEPWTVRNSLSIGKIMAWDLADWNIGLDLQRAVDQVGAPLARELHPGYPDWGATILGSDAEWKGRDRRRVVPVTRVSAAPLRGVPLPRVPALAAELLDAASIVRASNSWVIGGRLTRSGKPILANDPHLALRAPSLWYLAALHAGDLDVTGVTIPGTPAVVLGHTPTLAWGFTNAMVDDVDFFVERTDPADSTRYLAPDGWRRFQVREETIAVKGQAPVRLRVRATRHGPVLSGVEERTGERVLAMQWTALTPSTTLRALLRMNRARSASQFLAAIRDFNDPHQNIVFADDAGNFGYWLVGRVPVRRAGDGVLPVPGWTGEGDWTRFLDFDEHPHLLNPAEGFIVTANNRPVGPEYPYLLGSFYADPFRATRIREMLAGGSGFDAEDVALQQLDVVDHLARRYLPIARRAAAAAGDTAALGELSRWNQQARADSRAAALFYSWYEELRHRVGDDEFRGGEVFFPRYALNRVLDAGGGAWVDDVRTPTTETLHQLAVAAMRQAVITVGTRTWGDLHRTVMSHPLGEVSALDRTLGLNIGPFPNHGSANTVNVAGHGSRPPFTNTHGASMRHVVDLGDPDRVAGLILPTGQSGNPLAARYRDQTDRWLAGRLWTIPLDRRRAAAGVVERMRMTPR